MSHSGQAPVSLRDHFDQDRWREGGRDGWREGARDVPDVVEATCPRNRSSAPAAVGLSIHVPVNGAVPRRRGDEASERRTVSAGSGPPFALRLTSGVRAEGPRGRGAGEAPGGCSLCNFRNQMNPGEGLGGRSYGNGDGGGGRGVIGGRPGSEGRGRGAAGRLGGRGGGGRAGGGGGGWGMPGEAVDNQRPVSVADEPGALRTPAASRPDIAPVPGENAIGARPLPSNWAAPTPALPDLLNSHRVPPPYDAQPPPSPRPVNARGHGVVRSGAGQASRPLSIVAQLNSSAERKGCCSRQLCIRCLVAMTTFRWLLVSFGLLGIGCIVAGVVLGALQMTSASGSYLLHSVVFIGLGVFLLVVIVVGWRCTPTGREPCHLLFNLGDDGITSVARGRHIHRRHRCRNDAHHWFGGVLYPEFHNRCPPPTYSASAQDYQHQVLLAQLQLAAATIHSMEYLGLPTTPPPTYRSRPATLQRPPATHNAALLPAGQGDRCPPTYARSRPPPPSAPLAGPPSDDSIASSSSSSRRPEPETACGWCAAAAAATVAQPVASGSGSSRELNPAPPAQAPFRLRMKNVVAAATGHLTNQDRPIGGGGKGAEGVAMTSPDAESGDDFVFDTAL